MSNAEVYVFDSVIGSRMAGDRHTYCHIRRL